MVIVPFAEPTATAPDMEISIEVRNFGVAIVWEGTSLFGPQNFTFP